VQFVFGEYMLDPDRRELTNAVEPIALGPRVFDLLLYLVRHRERVVGKEELLDAVWGGRIVSESTVTSHINAMRKAIGDSGSEQRLVRTVARKGFRFVANVRELALPDDLGRSGQVLSGANGPLELVIPKKPSIAALPFLNLSGDPEQEYFADGMVEDIITSLSRVGWLFVIARNSSFAYKGRLVDVKQVSRELGVRYVLEGSVRKASNRVRITGQLVDATTGGNLWAERFEGSLDDIFQLQDEMVASVVCAIMPQLERAEIERAQHKPTEILDAYDYYLRGMTNFHVGTKDGLDCALSLFHRAIELDPEYASAYGMAAFCCYWRRISGWMADYEQEVAEGARLALRAVELGKHDAVALTRGGHALGHFGGDLDTCINIVDRALVLNPNLSAAWYLSGFQRISRGEPDLAIPRFERAMRLSPLDPETVRMRTGMAMAHLFAGRLDAASSWAEKASGELPTFLLAFGIIAAIQALAGRTEEAQRAMCECRRLNPTLRISNLSQWVLLRRPQDFAMLADGLRKSGLPD
jgi:TolB-like protein